METQNPSHDPQTQHTENDDLDVITSLVNREIYTLSGLFVGSVHDVQLDFNSLEISHLVVRAEDINPDAYSIQSGKDGVLIPYRWVRSVGDIVLINDIGPRKNQSASVDEAYAQQDD